ncbi:NAD(P)H-binding protein [Microbacterium sp. EYE_5]|uniref:NAD(P)-dependent oxidoreductase n=1 Tax=unclassified Microbacterium TaxID=2609290 RepID=UPI00200501CD|nr:MULTISPECIES: NAD(P)H-binding protein [unclassified Microbacterium]MCK6081806.1 NAD(P)H-binding protein [Microbacterium sp. EYE_382]MCK6087076.1 NAD(P)H-binding protein [Microbacterium sp. EYE_384]MCK6124946.1 NAD(P)H-binding protein [Microbacterium sp. EYE_80]MCK6127839.1 NAD(P)H-binding protein [Microbacterium sp. EYE_79]MCK6142760.1 NAD(P)H-binding protein [Microbacterium sp. EYE_39]
MTRIAVIGGTGYAGSHIVAEAARRGHTVVSVARKVPDQRVEGATYVEGTMLDAPALAAELEGVEVVVFATSPRGDMVGKMRDAVGEVIRALPLSVRVGVIGGAGGSLVAPGGPRVIDSGFPEEIKPEAMEAIGILEDLESDTTGREWFYIHPAGGFGAWAPGERTGSYRDGGDVIVTDADGESFISGADFGIAVLDEIESPKHRNERFTVGY